jgi:tripartite-type tricarboxylate transporter receptor subunit TctC
MTAGQAKHARTGAFTRASLVAVLIRVAAAASFLAPLAAASQTYPAKPIRLVVTIVPGGSVDLIARRFGVKLNESLGQPIVVENIAGASGTIGAMQVVRAAPDGYTLMWCTVGETIVYKFLSRNQPYDSLKDFSPIIAAVSPVTVLAAHPSVPGNNLKDVIDYARANPGKFAYASAGIGSYFHMTGELFKHATGLDILHVPYKGAPPALMGLSTGQVQLMFVSVLSAQSFMSKIKVLAVNEPVRYPLMPNVPSITEFVPGFERLPTWYAYLGPAGLPRPIVNRLNAEVNKALVAPDIKEYLATNALISLGGTPEDLASALRKGIDLYAEAVKLSGLKPE